MRFSKLLVPLILLCLSGCVGHSSFTEEKRKSDFNAQEIKDIYVYSFLDARREYTGESLFPVFQKTLSDRFAQHGVRTHWLWFEESTFGQMYSAAEKGGTDGYGKMVPVGLVTTLNRPQELTSGATHRLIIFPKTVGLTGLHQAEEEYYALISWTLERQAAPGDAVLKGSSTFYSRPRRATKNLQEDVDGLVDDFLNPIYTKSAKGDSGN